ncbi:MAG TPA: exodeoxyribonuclease VII small subunit [Coxiellaceae bacterium]|nr:MAG: exodeoxyribonuclease VII small subunit [Gammaproteobacteria bacterium RIFCSPHIGHO2_12_FULL_36_30]HLB56801.1 exodeoxyribonuclease VII small subunit [Coxiellaceae bacterium]
MSTTRKTKKTAPADFEKSLTHLNQLIEKMETGQLSLEASLSCFEEGIALIRHCQQTLNTAEQKIQILTEKTGKTSLTDFNHDE